MGLKFRRGTTAQQSGSLAFGEPYVNTTLGTLVIGGQSGDIVLSSGGTGSTGNFGAISGSGLDITGNANIAGNLTLGGAITIGDASADTVNVVASISSSLIPSLTNAFDLGSETKIWRDLYISTGSIKFIGAGNAIVGTLSNSGNGMALDGGVIARGDSTFGTSSLAVTSVTGSLAVNGRIIATSITGAIAATNGVVSGSSQVIAILDSLNTFSGSSLTRFTEIGVVSGSLITSASAAKTTNDSQDVSVTNLNSFTSSINTTIKSKLDADGVVSGSSQITYANISSIPSGIISGSSQLSGTTITNLTITNLTTVNQTASVLFSSGSNKFGDFSNDTHEFTGSVQVSGSLTTIGASTATSFNGTINATNGVVSGSAQIDGSLLGSNKTITIGSTATTLGGTSTTIAGLTSVTSTGFTGALTGNASTATTLATARTINGTSFDGGSNITIPNLVSGSAQIDGSLLGSNKTITIGSTATTLGGTSTTIAGLTSVTSTAFVGALTGNASTVTTNANLTGNVTSVGNATTIASGVVTSDMIVDGTIVNGDINASAAIVDTKLATISTGGKVSNSATTATSANTNSAIVARDGSGNFSAGTITAALTGNASTATALATTRAINGVNFDGSAAITITANTTNALTIGTGLSGTSFNGSAAITIANTGVTSNVASTGISVSGATGAVTITNTGVTSNVAGTGVSVSGATGAVTISIGQAVATSSNVQFNSLGIGMAASATAGRIDATNDIVAFSSSDIRFKENITPIENALDKISKISGNTYDWKAENKAEHGYEGNDVGVIAQEIEVVLPQLVQTRENGYKAVKYDKLVALLIEGIKEQQTQIEKLRMDLDNYECKCDNCKSE